MKVRLNFPKCRFDFIPPLSKLFAAVVYIINLNMVFHGFIVLKCCCVRLSDWLQSRMN